MREPTLLTVADVLFWSYANLGMAQHAVYHKASEWVQAHYIIRNRLWSGFRKGTMHPTSAVKDVRAKARRSQTCIYCGGSENVSLDHMIPKSRGGRESADNIVFACRSCNSSKGDRDVLDWYARKGIFPPLFVLRVYLKEVITHCTAHGLMDQKREQIGDVPFSLTAIPLIYPAPRELIYYPGESATNSEEAPAPEGDSPLEQ